jgi:ribosomal-protein-alanine N-acetyltransferase
MHRADGPAMTELSNMSEFLPPQAELPVIRTARLVLRPMTLEDAADVFAYSADPAVLQYTTGITPARLEETESWLRDLLDDPETHMWALRLEDDDRVIGALELGVPSPGVGSVHYAIGRDYWGGGLMTEAVDTICQWAFETLTGMHEISTSVVEANVASARVLEKCRFRRVGTSEERWEKEPEAVRLVQYRRGRDD